MNSKAKQQYVRAIEENERIKLKKKQRGQKKITTTAINNSIGFYKLA